MPRWGNADWSAMPSPIERLEQRLATSVGRLLPEGHVFPDTGIEAMRKMVERIRKVVGDRPATPSKDRICGAIRKLREHGAASLDGAEFYFACWGLTEICDHHPPLIEDGAHFSGLMSEVQRRKPATLLWQGLLDAYFRYEPSSDQPVGEKNWQLLRMWLAQDLNKLRQRTSPGLAPHLPWLGTLSDQRNLLADNPCHPYAQEALQGKMERIDRIKADLGIPERSWFWAKLVNSQVDEATGWRDDNRFKAVLDTLISQLREHSTVRNAGLAKLLTRYADCTDQSAQEGLKQFSVETWGSPQLVQQVGWGGVEPMVKAMVSQWLVLEDLRDFFELLQADRAADQRRLKFWLRFIKQISFSHIVLGSHVWWSHDPDWMAFKQKKKGRISRLDGGSGSRNAFIMKIGQFYFVEFGEIGDACYGYVEGNEPFRLGSGLLSYPDELKNKQKKVFWGRHFDGRKHWERTFLEELANLGIRRD